MKHIPSTKVPHKASHTHRSLAVTLSRQEIHGLHVDQAALNVQAIDTLPQTLQNLSSKLRGHYEVPRSPISPDKRPLLGRVHILQGN